MSKSKVSVARPFRVDSNQGRNLELEHLRSGFDLTFACLPVGRNLAFDINEKYDGHR
jgi:hypothetical protein